MQTSRPIPLLPPRPNIIRAVLCSLERIKREQTDQIQRDKPYRHIREPAVPRHQVLQAGERALAHRLAGLRRAAERAAFGGESSGRGASAACVGGGFADSGGERGRVGAADGFDYGFGLDDEEGGHAVGGLAVFLLFFSSLVCSADAQYVCLVMGRNLRRYPVFLRDFLLRIHVHLDKLQFPGLGLLLGQGLEDGRNRFAGPAPIGVEIDDCVGG